MKPINSILKSESEIFENTSLIRNLGIIACQQTYQNHHNHQKSNLLCDASEQG